MEKLLYVFWRGPGKRRGSQAPLYARRHTADLTRWAPSACSSTSPTLPTSAARSSISTLHNTKPAPDGIVSFWLTSAYRRAPLEALLAATFARIAGYEVTESTILPNLRHPPHADERTYGFSQVTFLQVPPRLGYEEWRRIWFEEHTPVGIATQANFLYVAQRGRDAAHPGSAAVSRHRGGVLSARGAAGFAGVLRRRRRRGRDISATSSS